LAALTDAAIAAAIDVTIAVRLRNAAAGGAWSGGGMEIFAAVIAGLARGEALDAGCWGRSAFAALLTIEDVADAVATVRTRAAVAGIRRATATVVVAARCGAISIAATIARYATGVPSKGLHAGMSPAGAGATIAVLVAIKAAANAGADVVLTLTSEATSEVALRVGAAGIARFSRHAHVCETLAAAAIRVGAARNQVAGVLRCATARTGSSVARLGRAVVGDRARCARKFLAEPRKTCGFRVTTVRLDTAVTPHTKFRVADAAIPFATIAPTSGMGQPETAGASDRRGLASA